MSNADSAVFDFFILLLFLLFLFFLFILILLVLFLGLLIEDFYLVRTA